MKNKIFFKDWDIEQIIEIVLLAGKEIMKIYDSRSVNVYLKKDSSPVTCADKLSQKIIIKGLKDLFPEIPVISEESRNIPFKKRKNWEYFWLIDPLDGTKEFIKRIGEFTINVALIYKNYPVFGIVSVPLQEVLYFGYKDKGSFKRSRDGKIRSIKVRKSIQKRIVVVRSRSHKDKREEEIINCFDDAKIIHAGSSLKFCRVAEGLADIYIRSGPTMEWDTAAGQCIAECAGAWMCDLGGKPFKYNKKSLKNPGFLCGRLSGSILAKVRAKLSSRSM